MFFALEHRIFTTPRFARDRVSISGECRVGAIGWRLSRARARARSDSLTQRWSKINFVTIDLGPASFGLANRKARTLLLGPRSDLIAERVRTNDWLGGGRRPLVQARNGYQIRVALFMGGRWDLYFRSVDVLAGQRPGWPADAITVNMTAYVRYGTQGETRMGWRACAGAWSCVTNTRRQARLEGGGGCRVAATRE